YEHPLDHHWLRLGGRQGFVYHAGRGAGSRPIGYAYTSAVGRVGPIAVLDDELLPAIAGHALDAILPRGASSLRVSGASTALFSGLLRAGFRIDEFPALLCWTRPFADFARYVPNSLPLHRADLENPYYPRGGRMVASPRRGSPNLPAVRHERPPFGVASPIH